MGGGAGGSGLEWTSGRIEVWPAAEELRRPPAEQRPSEVGGAPQPRRRVLEPRLRQGVPRSAKLPRGPKSFMGVFG